MPRLTPQGREMKKYAEGLGYELIRWDRHLVFEHPSTGRRVVASTSPSDPRAIKNAQAQLRRGAA